MYHPDFSIYRCAKDDIDNLYYTVNIGWLDSEHEYPKGQVSDLFLDKLWDYCCESYIITFGCHSCDFCNEEEEMGVYIKRGNASLVVGSQEIRIIGDGIVYAAPDMIYHYIVDHQYLPPKQFIEAVLNSPFPLESMEYKKRYFGE